MPSSAGLGQRREPRHGPAASDHLPGQAQACPQRQQAHAGPGVGPAPASTTPSLGTLPALAPLLRLRRGSLRPRLLPAFHLGHVWRSPGKRGTPLQPWVAGRGRLSLCEKARR